MTFMRITASLLVTILFLFSLNFISKGESRDQNPGIVYLEETIEDLQETENELEFLKILAFDWVLYYIGHENGRRDLVLSFENFFELESIFYDFDYSLALFNLPPPFFI